MDEENNSNLLILLLSISGNRLAALAAEDQTPEELNNLYARSAVLMDGDTGRILYGKNENDVMPMASTTKIMTCILTLGKRRSGFCSYRIFPCCVSAKG